MAIPVLEPPDFMKYMERKKPTKIKCRICGRTLPWHLHKKYKDDPAHLSCKRREEKKMAKTKLEILKGTRDFFVPESPRRELIQQIIEAINNPLGVVPGDKIMVWDGEGSNKKEYTYVHYNQDMHYPWICSSGDYFKHAELPAEPAEPAELTEDQKKVLNEVVGTLENQSSLHARIKETFKL